MDYGFAPVVLKGHYEESVQELFRRSDINVITEDSNDHKKIRHIQGFLKELEVSVGPFGDLWIGSHSNRFGTLAVALDKSFFSPGKKQIKQIKETTYEDIEEAIKSGNINLPISLWQKQGEDNPTIHIRGCGIGEASPFLKKLKDAFKDANSITAPRHGHNTRTEWYGSFEWLSRKFLIFQKEPYKSNQRSDLITAFTERDSIYIGDEEVPGDQFDKWIPKDINKKNPIRYSVTFGKSVGKNKKPPEEISKGKYIHLDPKFTTFTLRIKKVQPAPPKEERFDIMKNTMLNDDRFKSNHEFSFYKRYGYSSFDEWLNGWTWNLNNYNKNNQTLTCVGTRYEYAIEIPITRSLTDKTLHFNFYPSEKGIKKDYEQVSDLDEANIDLFKTV